MDPTTLVTFLFGAPHHVHTVELLGSWDNFHRPYQMHQDRRRGSGFWSGCFKFEDIIFDGEVCQPTRPRSGGLKQGGTYWYFYRLNYDIDTHDDRRPSTTFCPLLPGQPVNVMEVPHEIVEVPTRCQSAYGEMIGNLMSWQTTQTLDPASKYAMLEPPPISKVHVRCLSDYALNGRLENQPVVVVKEVISPLNTACSEQDYEFDLGMAFPERHDVSRSISVSSQLSLRSDVFDRHWTNAQQDGIASFPHRQPSGLASLPSLEQIPRTTPSPLPSTLSRSDSGLMPTHCREKKSEWSIGPCSISNVQFYGSRPGTSLNDDPEQHRPRTYSVPNAVGLRQSAEHSRPVSPLSCVGYSLSPLQCTNLDTMPTHDDISAFDFGFASPSFSTSTASSDDGHSSPQSPTSPSIPRTMPQQPSQEDHPPRSPSTHSSPPNSASPSRPPTTTRFTSLRNRFRPKTAQPPPSTTSPPHSRTTSFSAFAMNYSLPSLALATTSSSTKTLPQLAIDLPPLPTTFISNRTSPVIYSPTTTRGEGECLAEAILAELGF